MVNFMKWPAETKIATITVPKQNRVFVVFVYRPDIYEIAIR